MDEEIKYRCLTDDKDSKQWYLQCKLNTAKKKRNIKKQQKDETKLSKLEKNSDKENKPLVE